MRESRYANANLRLGKLMNFLSGGLIPVALMFKNSMPRIKFAIIIVKFTLLCTALIIDSIPLKLLIE